MIYLFVVWGQIHRWGKWVTQERRNCGKVFQLIHKIFYTKSVIVYINHIFVVDIESSVNQDFEFIFSGLDEVDTSVAFDIFELVSVVIYSGHI